MNKDYRPKLRKLSQSPRWKKSLFPLTITLLVFSRHALDFYFYLNANLLFARRAFARRKVTRAHYIGAHIHKPHRLAFYALAMLVLAVAFNAAGVTRIYWAIGWGSVFSAFVLLQSFKIVFQRLKYSRPITSKTT